MPAPRHPFRHDVERLAFDEPGLQRIQVVVGRTRPHRPQRPVPLHDQAVLPDPDHREFPGNRLQGQMVGGGQFQRVPMGPRHPLVLLPRDVEVLEQGLQAIPKAEVTERIERRRRDQ